MSRAHAALADTLALVSFFTVTGTLNEALVAGMAPGEVVRARLVGIPLMLLTAWPYGLWRDWALRVLAPPGAPGSPLRRVAADSAALLSFQVPLYALVIGAGGADGPEVLRGCAGAAVLMLVAGRPYGLWLDFIRRRLAPT